MAMYTAHCTYEIMAQNSIICQ